MPRMPIRTGTVSRIIGEDDNKLWRMVRCYVEKARRCENYSSVSSMGTDRVRPPLKKDMIM